MQLALDASKVTVAALRTELDDARAAVASLASGEARVAALSDAARTEAARLAELAAEKEAKERDARAAEVARIALQVADERNVLETQRTFLEAQSREMAEERDAMRKRLDDARAGQLFAEEKSATLAAQQAELEQLRSDVERQRTVVEYERASLLRQREALVQEKDRWYSTVSQNAETQRRDAAMQDALRRATEEKAALAKQLAVIDVVASSRRRAEAAAVQLRYGGSGSHAAASTPLPPAPAPSARRSPNGGGSPSHGIPRVHINRSNSIFISSAH